MSPAPIPDETCLPISPGHHVVSGMVTNSGSVTMGTMTMSVTMINRTIKMFIQAELFHPVLMFIKIDLMTHIAFVLLRWKVCNNHKMKLWRTLERMMTQFSFRVSKLTQKFYFYNDPLLLINSKLFQFWQHLEKKVVMGHFMLSPAIQNLFINICHLLSCSICLLASFCSLFLSSASLLFMFWIIFRMRAYSASTPNTWMIQDTTQVSTAVRPDNWKRKIFSAQIFKIFSCCYPQLLEN